MSEPLSTIRNAWISAMTTPDPDNYYDAITEEEAIYAWDHALAAHDREAKAEAWDEGFQEGYCLEPRPDWANATVTNPYRIESQETP